MIEQIKKHQLEVLDFVTEFCDEHNIKYFIHAGTLIGAIRHKGFIPWDDDIDIGMLRPEYDKFRKLFNSSSDSRYEFTCMEDNNKFHLPFGKVIDKKIVVHEPEYLKYGCHEYYHVNIDVFPFDNAPENKNEIRKMFFRRDFYTILLQEKSRPVFVHIKRNISPIKKLIVHSARFLSKFFSSQFLVNKIIKNRHKYDNLNTSKVAIILGCPNWHRVVVDKDLFKSYIEADFEGKKYNTRL